MTIRFSRRTSWNTSEDLLFTAHKEAIAKGRCLIDLTQTNPTKCHFTYNEGEILKVLHSKSALAYDPDPLGGLAGRRAVCGYYLQHAASIDPAHLLLAASTSEAYTHLFRLLCESGDEVLVPAPSYPLFDYLADLQDVGVRPYPLFYDFGWWIDFAELERSISDKTKAIIVVHPNNPTGHITGMRERERLEDLCAERNLALIVDEVFLDYPLDAEAAEIRSFACSPHPALTFVLSGLSKVAALPQMKLSWIATFGPTELVGEAMSRLEVIGDTFLSVNSPVMNGLAELLEVTRPIQSEIRQRAQRNLGALREAGINVLQTDAGWSAVVRLPHLNVGTAEDTAIELLERFSVVVHPGSFYGMTEKNRIVVSLLGEPEEFDQGVEALSAYQGISAVNNRRE